MNNESKKALAVDILSSMPPMEAEQQFSERDTILYNLGLGFGAAAIENPALLSYVLEGQLTTFPTMACVLGVARDLYYNPRYGIDFGKIVHGEEEVETFTPVPASGSVRGVSRIDGLWDRGADKGAIMRISKTLFNATGEQVAITRSTMMLRGNGGFGGTTVGMPQTAQLPERVPDGFVEVTTRPEQALIYRLSGDTNPLHSTPVAAQKAGFPRPILHGLCSFGVAAWGLVSALGNGDATKLRRFGLRFTSPVYPGETLRIEYWRLDDGSFMFRARAIDRDLVVLSGGRAVIA